MSKPRVGFPYMINHPWEGTRLRSEGRNIFQIAKAAHLSMRDDYDMFWVTPHGLDDNLYERAVKDWEKMGLMFPFLSTHGPREELPDLIIGTSGVPEQYAIPDFVYEHTSYMPITATPELSANDNILSKIPLVVYFSDLLDSDLTQRGSNLGIETGVWHPGFSANSLEFKYPYDVVIYMHCPAQSSISGKWSEIMLGFYELSERFGRSDLKVACILGGHIQHTAHGEKILQKYFLEVVGADIYTELPYFAFKSICSSSKVLFDPYYFHGYYVTPETVIAGDARVVSPARLHPSFAKNPYDSERVKWGNSYNKLADGWEGLIYEALEDKHEAQWSDFTGVVREEFSLESSAIKLKELVDYTFSKI